MGSSTELAVRRVCRQGITGNLVTDAQLAAIAIEHGLDRYSTDTDFARRRRPQAGVGWKNRPRISRNASSRGPPDFMAPINSTPAGEQREIVAAWADRCRALGAQPEHCAGSEARYLLSALRGAVRSESGTPELGRAARSWGARFSAPVDALTSLSALREVVVDSAGRPGDRWRADWLPVAAVTFNRVIDQLMREAIDAASNNLRTEARTDMLTGCANRLALSEELARATAGAERSGLGLSVAMVDLDGLKRINDSGGHDAGDLALQGLVASLRSVLRDADTLYRVGGDEFVVMAPFTDEAGAIAMLRRAEQQGAPRFSWGVASLADLGPEVGDHPALLVSAADQDLYRRRGNGRTAASGVARRNRAALVAATLAVATAARRNSARVGLVAASLLLAAGTAAGLSVAMEHQPTIGGPSAAGSSPGDSTASTSARPPATTSPPSSATHPRSAPHGGAAGKVRSSTGHPRSSGSSTTSSGSAGPGASSKGASNKAGGSNSGASTTATRPSIGGASSPAPKGSGVVTLDAHPTRGSGNNKPGGAQPKPPTPTPTPTPPQTAGTLPGPLLVTSTGSHHHHHHHHHYSHRERRHEHARGHSPHQLGIVTALRRLFDTRGWWPGRHLPAAGPAHRVAGRHRRSHVPRHHSPTPRHSSHTRDVWWSRIEGTEGR
jgi:diguanylate cyclase (GGDEF)-like protein